MYPEHFRPLIIVGRQRAGTRFLTTLLNTFEEVTIQGEISNHVLESAIRFIQETNAYYVRVSHRGPRHRRHERLWRRKREDLLFSIWELAGQSRAVEYGPACRYFGYKRPNNEQYFAFYEEAFASRPPVYVYCVRNFVDNFLSVVSRWPERSIDDVANDYLASVEQYHRMKASAPDRVLLFNLDDHVKTGFGHIERNVIRPLGLDLTEAHREKLVQMKGRNRTVEDLKIPRRKELTSAEQLFLNDHQEIEAAFRSLSANG